MFVCFQFYTDKATNPLNKEIDWDSIKGFCDQLENEPEGWVDDDSFGSQFHTEMETNVVYQRLTLSSWQLVSLCFQFFRVVLI